MEQLTDGQYFALGSAIEERERAAIIWLVSHLLDQEIDELDVSHWRAIRDRAYPDWKTGDWATISHQFIEDLANANRRYLEHLGQERLFE